MDLQQVVNQAFKDKEYFEKNNVSLALQGNDGEILTIPTKLIFSNNWVITREITEESNPSFFKLVTSVFKALNGGRLPKSKKPSERH